jgi:putative endonuclease
MWMNLPKQPAVYILTSKRNGTLYTGVASDLVKRIWQHRNNVADSFTKKYAVHMLVYYELADEMATAIAREKQIKGGSRTKKLALIESMNPGWRDLYDDILG